MGLEDLHALQAAADEQEEQSARERDRMPDFEPMRCTLTAGNTVVFDVPNTRK